MFLMADIIQVLLSGFMYDLMHKPEQHTLRGRTYVVEEFVLVSSAAFAFTAYCWHIVTYTFGVRSHTVAHNRMLRLVTGGRSFCCQLMNNIYFHTAD